MALRKALIGLLVLIAVTDTYASHHQSTLAPRRRSNTGHKSHHQKRGCSAPSSAVASASQALLTSTAGGFVSVAYYANYDIYNVKPYYPSDLPVTELTHVIYGFAQISPNGTVSAGDTYADMINKVPGDASGESGTNVYGNFKQLFLLKAQNRNLKTILSIGGGGAKNFEYINDTSYRAAFVKSAVQMLEDFGFDGIDIDWEFPSGEQTTYLYTLYSGLRVALDDLAGQTNTTPFLLGIDVPGGGAFPPYTSYIHKFDQIVDLVFSMDYCNCESNYQPTACDNANLRGGAANTTSTIEWLIENGATPGKIVMGSPLFGYVYAGTAGHDQPYDSTKTPPGDGNGLGTYAVKNLPLASMDNATISMDNETVASWAYHSETQTLASYDTPEIAAMKAEWIVEQKLAGAMYWEISNDHDTTETSLVSQYAAAFQKAGGGLASSCNHLYYPDSKSVLHLLKICPEFARD
ncbi:hypothetical protein FRB94_002857 [Tulasnella sp. JGI-2019a]|nr:hypothetical protein FRB94_002857 [Tulasnella sp. JGI-2019a]